MTRTTGGGTWKHLLCAPKYQALLHSTLHRESRYILLTAQYSTDCYQPHCRDGKAKAWENQGHKGLEKES